MTPVYHKGWYLHCHECEARVYIARWKWLAHWIMWRKNEEFYKPCFPGAHLPVKLEWIQP